MHLGVCILQGIKDYTNAKLGLSLIVSFPIIASNRGTWVTYRQNTDSSLLPPFSNNLYPFAENSAHEPPQNVYIHGDFHGLYTL